MQIDIPSHIEKLLFLHEALVIPGFGGFTATRTPATTDYVGGTVNSPSKILSFSENLTVDDGILINDIALTHGISVESAQKVVDEFVEKMKNLLSQREIVTLSGVGRLYKNYVQKIQFLPDSTNFNAASYGLPPLQFSPIARSREVSEHHTTEINQREDTPISNETLASMPPPTMPESTYAPQRSKKSSLGPILGIVFFLVSIIAGIWYWQQNKKTDNTSDNTTLEVPKPKATKKITVEPAAAAPTEKSVQESVNERIAAARKQVKSGRECILIVATLSQSENAEKLRKTLENEGYSVFYQQKKGFVVGIQFNYTDPSEIQDNIDDLKRLTGVSNIIVKKK
jgi:hypothetical protein